jgi:hypothetical protein
MQKEINSNSHHNADKVIVKNNNGISLIIN